MCIKSIVILLQLLIVFLSTFIVNVQYGKESSFSLFFTAHAQANAKASLLRSIET